MNQKFTNNSLFSIPSQFQFPELNCPSMHLINTYNQLNFTTHNNLDLPQPHENEDSLAERISHNNTAANSAKKKKIGCTCKKTFCLKMYCECFASGKPCGQDCVCSSCKNSPQNHEQVQAAKLSLKEGGLRNCSLAEKRCNCKKSNCQKRYCECYNSGVGCSEACKCEGCLNREIKSVRKQQQQSKQKLEIVVSQQSFREQIQSKMPMLNLQKSIEDLQRFYT